MNALAADQTSRDLRAAFPLGSGTDQHKTLHRANRIRPRLRLPKTTKTGSMRSLAPAASTIFRIAVAFEVTTASARRTAPSPTLTSAMSVWPDLPVSAPMFLASPSLMRAILGYAPAGRSPRPSWRTSTPSRASNATGGVPACSLRQPPWCTGLAECDWPWTSAVPSQPRRGPGQAGIASVPKLAEHAEGVAGD